MMRRQSLFLLRTCGSLFLGVICALLLFSVCGSRAAEPRVEPVLPPLGDDVPTSVDEVETKWQYSWAPDAEVVYKFEIDVEIAKRAMQYRGRNRLTLAKDKPTPDALDLGERTGSGIVVHPAGIIVTCAHLVYGATELNVKLGDNDYPATLIGIDFDQDLAVLRVETTELPHVTFADSDQVRLADEVRAIGYPLTKLLGDSIKVTKGEISGIGGPFGKSGLQVDASINPGNSGGPLVDNTGHVVGLTSSLLSGAGISEVGFAIPANDVVEYLQGLNIPVAVSKTVDPQEPAEVVARIAPACGLIEVKYGPNGIGTKRLSKLDSISYWHETTRPEDVRQILSRRPVQHFQGHVVVSEKGDIFASDDDARLPYLLGSLASVGIEKLPVAAPGTATTTSIVVLQQTGEARSPERFSPYAWRPSYRSRLRAPWGDRRESPSNERQLMTGTESVTYQFESPREGFVDLKKEYELLIGGNESGDEPYISMKGTGKGKFDEQTALMQSMDFRAQLVISEDNITVRIPLRMQYELMTAEQLAEEEQERLKRATERENRIAEQQQLAPQTEVMPALDASTSPEDLSSRKPTSIKSMPNSKKLDKFDPNK